MEKEEYLEKLLVEFWNSIKVKPALTIPFSHSIDFKILHDSIIEYSRSGNNPLNEYHDLIEIKWKACGYDNRYYKPFMNKEQADYFRNLLSGKGFWDIKKLFKKAEVENVYKYLRDAEYNYAESILMQSIKLLSESRKTRQTIKNTSKGKLELSYNRRQRIYKLTGNNYSESGKAGKIQKILFSIINHAFPK